MDVPGAYVSGVLNSTPVQELAETLPPGYLRRADFLELGAPLVSDLVETVAHAATEAADTVEELARYASSFPELVARLKEDVSLSDVPASVWLPAPGADAQMGSVDSVTWLTIAEEHSLGQHRVASVVVDRDLLGLKVVALGPEASRASLSISIGVDEEDTAEALAAYLRGAASTGCRLREVRRLSVPTEPDSLKRARAHDLEGLVVLVDRYRGTRATIDDLLAPFL
jgi:hypothetical protein